jgi:hypothetical protein
MVKEILNKLMLIVSGQFSMVIFTDDNASIFFAGGRREFLYHTSFSGFRFCVISAPKLLSLISVTCAMDTQSHTMSFVLICGILWHPVYINFPVIQLVCALPSECIAL